MVLPYYVLGDYTLKVKKYGGWDIVHFGFCGDVLIREQRYGNVLFCDYCVGGRSAGWVGRSFGRRGVEVKNYKEIKSLVASLISNGDIGVIGENNYTDADSYYCPGCGKTEDIKGHASPRMVHVDTMSHYDDCPLVRLRKLVEEPDDLTTDQNVV